MHEADADARELEAEVERELAHEISEALTGTGERPVDEGGNGVLRDGLLYQLVRQHDRVRAARTPEITSLEFRAGAYAFTFG